MAKKDKLIQNPKVLNITGKSQPQTFQIAYANLVYKNNEDGTYRILKNRYGNQDCNVSTVELIALLVYMVNNPR